MAKAVSGSEAVASFAACFAAMPKNMAHWTGRSVTDLATHRQIAAEVIGKLHGKGSRDSDILVKLDTVAGIVIALYRHALGREGRAIVRTVLNRLDIFAEENYGQTVVDRSRLEMVVAQIGQGRSDRTRNAASSALARS